MKSKKLTLWLVTLCLSLPLAAQQTAVFTEANRYYKQGTDFYDKGLFADAKQAFEQVTRMLLPANQPEAELLRLRSEFYYAKCAILLDQPDGGILIKDFIRKYRPDPITDQALLEVANYYFDKGEFDQAIEYYKDIPTLAMTRERRAEIRFKMGYAYFAKKEFANAKSMFEEIDDVSGDYYFPTNYYLGLCYFFEGNYNDAIRNFRIAEEDSRYKRNIPYYLTQIYFAQRRFQELIAYAEPRLSDSGLRDLKEIRQLVGQAYFELGNYKAALPHLEYYAKNTSKLREEEFYQLGFAQYQNGQCDAAIQSFKPLANVNSAIGQNAMLYLADCYIKTGQKEEALAALADAKRLTFDPAITEEAQYNYGKLAYELNRPLIAVKALQEVPQNSKYRTDAMNLLSDIVVNYRDYEEALNILEAIPNKTPQILEAMQKVALYRGMQLLQEDKAEEARPFFQRSLQYPIDQRIRAIATYWLGDIAHRTKDYPGSINYLNQFITMARTMNNLPDESSLLTASYLQGYNYFKREDYPTAVRFFSEAADGIQRNRRFIRNANVTSKLLGDALLRAGDSFFKRNQYPDAVRYYDLAIDGRYPDYPYAIFQKAIIEGLRGRNADKIIALERIVNEFPKSEYADDALLQLGATYQELGKLGQAVDPLNRLVTQYRTTSNLINEAYLKLGLISYNQGNLNGAVNYYKQIFGNNPQPDEAKRALAALEEIYVKDLGQPGEYFAFLETIPGYKVDNFARDSINYRAALTRFENADYARAVDAFSSYIRAFPQGKYLLESYFQRGESYAVLKQYSQALGDYDRVVGQGPSRYYSKALEKAAIIAYNHEQDFRKALDYYTKLEAAAPTENLRFEAQLGALRSAYRVGDAQAVYGLASKVANSPNANNQQKASAYFYLGKLAFDRNDYDNALTAFNQVIQLSDNEQTAEARYLKAYIFYQRRNLDEAQNITLNANKESSAYPYWVAKSVILLSDILAEKGDLYNARAALEALLDNYSEDAALVAEARSKLDRINQQIQNSSRLNLAPESNLMEFSNESQPASNRKNNR